MQKIARTRPVDQVTATLRAELLARRWPPGSALPPERELASTLGVSRLTLRAGLARLETEGLVRARQGDGVRVLDPARHGTLDLLAHLELREHPELVRSFLELRRLVAVEAVALAAERRTGEQLAELAAMAAAQRAERDDEVYGERDLAFSRAVLEASGSFAMVLLLNSLEGVWRAHPELSSALRADRAASLAGYEAVIALLSARDAEGARTLIRPVLEAVDAAALERLRRSP